MLNQGRRCSVAAVTPMWPGHEASVDVPRTGHGPQLLREAIRRLRLPLLSNVLAGPSGTEEVEVHEGSDPCLTEVFFVDSEGNESTAREAVRVEVVTNGAQGEPVILAFSRFDYQVMNECAA